MQQSSNAGCSADSSNEKILSIEPERDKTGVHKPTVPRVENQVGTKMQTYHIVSLMTVGKPQAAQETGCCRRTVAERYSPFCRNTCAVYTQRYDSKMMFKEEDMHLWHEERGSEKGWQCGSWGNHLAYSLPLLQTVEHTSRHLMPLLE